MNKKEKKVTVRYFKINAKNEFYKDFISVQKANINNDNKARFFNIRDKKYLIKIHNEIDFGSDLVFFISVVRERNAWQVRAIRNGTISGITTNQGIIGDPYYFLVVPTNDIVLGFTTGVTSSLKSVANYTLQQFNKDRSSLIQVDHLSKKNEIHKLHELTDFNKLFFRVNTSSLREPTDGAPNILKDLWSVPFLPKNSEIAFSFTEIGEDGFSESDLIEIVDYLSENEGCSALTVHGLNREGVKVHLSFGKAYVKYRTGILLRNKYIDEEIAREILLNALDYLEKANISIP